MWGRNRGWVGTYTGSPAQGILYLCPLSHHGPVKLLLHFYQVLVHFGVERECGVCEDGWGKVTVYKLALPVGCEEERRNRT